jgi:hypothetical protein
MSAVLVGGFAVLIAIAFLDWYDFPSGGDAAERVTFRDLGATADHIDVPGIVPAYFDWLAWMLLIGVVAGATVAYVRPQFAPPLRVVGFLLGGIGSFLTWYALQKITSYGDEGSYAFQSATVGVWLAMIGYAVTALGAAIGPRRV